MAGHILKYYDNIQNRIAMVEKFLAYRFKDNQKIAVALTHTSYANENQISEIQSNERIEFLGDSIIGLVISEYLYLNYPDMDEGWMTKVRAQVVCEKSLAKWAREMKLNELLYFGNGALKSDAANRDSVLCDAFEAVIAAVYLDGNIADVKAFIDRTLIHDIKDAGNESIKDYKSLLQEYLQKEKDVNIDYKIVDEEGPDHSKNFTSIVLKNGDIIGKGSGNSKKNSQQEAARAAMDKLGLL